MFVDDIFFFPTGLQRRWCAGVQFREQYGTALL